MGTPSIAQVAESSKALICTSVRIDKKAVVCCTSMRVDNMVDSNFASSGWLSTGRTIIVYAGRPLAHGKE